MKNKSIIIFLILLSILVVFCIIFLVLFNNKSDGIGSAGISLEEFKKINNGMTQSEVEKIIDSDDLWNDDNVYAQACIKLEENKNNSIYKYTYKYLGEDNVMICDPTHYPKSKIHLKVNLYILYIFLPSFSSVYIKNI